jgi:hypothetical protein
MPISGVYLVEMCEFLPAAYLLRLKINISGKRLDWQHIRCFAAAASFIATGP